MKTGGKQNDVNRNTFALKVGTILADLRKENGLTQKEFGEIFNISESAVSHYEQGINLINVELLCEIAKHFNVPTDYLLGRCLCKVEYTKLNSILHDKMTFGEMINIVDSLTKANKSYLHKTILFLKKD